MGAPYLTGVHVAVEATGIKHGGGAHVLMRLLNALLQDVRVGRVTLFASVATERRFLLPPDEPQLVVIEPPLVESVGWRVLWLEAGLARECGELKPDVVWCMNGVGYTGDVPQVNMIQQPLLFKPRVLRKLPTSFQLRMSVIRQMTRASCHRAERVVVQTPTVAALASSMFNLPLSRLRVHTPDIVWSEHAQISPAVLAMRARDTSHRVLYVGSDIAYKGLPMLVAAVARLRQHYPNLKLFATLDIDHSLAKHECVHALGHLSPGEVRACMQLADMLVMPSLAETVGLPMLEAMSVGCPVVASDLPYAHDVCDDAARFFSPGHVKSCARAMVHVLKDPILVHQLKGRGALRTEHLRQQMPYARMVDVLVDVVASKGSDKPRAARSV